MGKASLQVVLLTYNEVMYVYDLFSGCLEKFEFNHKVSPHIYTMFPPPYRVSSNMDFLPQGLNKLWSISLQPEQEYSNTLLWDVWKTTWQDIVAWLYLRRWYVWSFSRTQIICIMPLQVHSFMGDMAQLTVEAFHPHKKKMPSHHDYIHAQKAWSLVISVTHSWQKTTS